VRNRFHLSASIRCRTGRKTANAPQRHKVHKDSDKYCADGGVFGFFVSFAPLWCNFALFQRNTAVPGRHFRHDRALPGFRTPCSPDCPVMTGNGSTSGGLYWNNGVLCGLPGLDTKTLLWLIRHCSPTASSKPGPVFRCTSIAGPITGSVKDWARSMRTSVFPVVLRPSSVRIKNESLTHRPCKGGHTAPLATGSRHTMPSCEPSHFRFARRKREGPPRTRRATFTQPAPARPARAAKVPALRAGRQGPRPAPPHRSGKVSSSASCGSDSATSIARIASPAITSSPIVKLPVESLIVPIT
jgi:hypothetical protein